MKLLQGRKKLYDGLETQELYETVFPVYEYAFPVTEMIRYKFSGLETRFSASDFLQITQDSGIINSKDSSFSKDFYEKHGYIPFADIEHYESADGLTIYYKILNDSLLFLFSFGERQPARYQLFSEGVWRIDPVHRFHGNMGEPDTVSSFVLMYGVDPRTGQLPIKTLRQLRDTLLVKGCTQFYIAAESIGGPMNTDVDVLDFVDSSWVVRDPKGQTLFSTSDKDEAIVFFYKHSMANKHRSQVVVPEPILESSPDPEAKPMIAEPDSDPAEIKSEVNLEHRVVPLHNEEYFPEIPSHNLKLFRKEAQRLFTFTASLGIIGLVLHLLGALGPGNLFYFFFAVLAVWCVIFLWRQDLSQPAFKVTSEGLFLNQQFIRNAFVPWANIAKVELRGHSGTPSIVLTFVNVKTLLKGQFFVFRSLAKAQLTPEPTMVISGFETEGDLKQTFSIIKQYLPEEKTIDAIKYDYDESRRSTKKESTYIRLEDNLTKEYYREILDDALQQAEAEYRQAPHSALYESFFNQLSDIRKTVVEQGTVYTEAEADKRYPLGIMAIRNFDGYPDDWEYPKKLVDISFGVSRYPNMPEKTDYRLNYEEECTEIERVFAVFFTEHHFTLKYKRTGSFTLVYENPYSELLFDFDSFGSRFGLIAPPRIIYRNKATDRGYAIEELLKQFHSLDYETLHRALWDEKQLGYYGAQKEILATYLNDLISDAQFSWLQNFKDHDYEFYTKEYQYTRLSENRTKKRYRQILEMAIDETEAATQRSPEIKMYQAILDQLRDLKQNIIIIHVVFTEEEIFARYNFGAIAAKNFDLEEDEYAQKLSDVFGGAIDYHEMHEE